MSAAFNGSNDNVQACEDKGVELVSRTPGKKPDDACAINSDDLLSTRRRAKSKGAPAASNRFSRAVTKPRARRSL